VIKKLFKSIIYMLALATFMTVTSENLFAEKKLLHLKIRGGQQLGDGSIGYRVVKQKTVSEGSTLGWDLKCKGSGLNHCAIHTSVSPLPGPHPEYGEVDEIEIAVTNYLITYASNQISEGNEDGGYNHVMHNYIKTINKKS